MKKILTIILLVSSISVFGQIGGATSINDPISAAMGNTSVTNSRGAYAVYRNPANLAFANDMDFEIATILPTPFPNLGLKVGLDFMTLDDFNYFFGGVEVNGQTQGRYLTAADKDRLLGLFEDGGSVFTNLSLNYFSITFKVDDQIGAFGFSISDQIAGNFTFPQGAIELVMNGNIVGKYFDFNDANLEASYLRDFTFSYARDLADVIPGPFEHINVGVNLKYIQGLAMVRTQNVSTSIVTNADNSIDISGSITAQAAISPDFGYTYDFDSTGTNDNNSFSPLLTPSGSGLGMDFGATATWKFLTFGFALNNIGSVTWTENVAEFNSDVAFVIEDITDEDQMDELADQAELDGEYVSEITTDLPTTLRIGASVQVDQLVENFPGTLVVATDIIQGFNSVSTNSEAFGMGLGLEWRPFKMWPIMTGISFGNNLPSAAWSFGTGLDTGVFEMMIAANNFGDFINGNQAQTIGFNFGTRFRF